jgi:hypothetical protein
MDAKLYETTAKLVARLRQEGEVARVFDLGVVSDIAEAESEFATQFWMKGLFRLPFPNTILTVTMVAKDGSRYSQIISASQKDDEDPPLQVLIINITSNEMWAFGANPVTHIFYNLKPRPIGCSDLSSEDGSLVVYFLSWFVSSLISPSYVQTRHGPSERRVARNIAQGRDPGLVYHTITVDPTKVRAASTGSSGHSDRASPRMHWRRGHFRHLLKRGEPTIIPIPPTIVGAAENGEVISDYLVKRKA